MYQTLILPNLVCFPPFLFLSIRYLFKHRKNITITKKSFASFDKPCFLAIFATNSSIK